MDKVKFDALTRAFATGTSRRTAIKGLFGGAVGVAVATTRLNPAGAQSCTPETVLEDCGTPNECTTSTCEQFGETWQCVYHSDCELNCCPGGYCAECCGNDDCEGSCDVCDSGTCVSTCTDCQECEGGICADLDNGVCCGGVWIEDGQCCTVSDCDLAPAATFCSSVDCIGNLCTVIPDCPDGQQCCGYGAEGAYCAECCSETDPVCEGCSQCVDGWCVALECCADSDCPDCYECDVYGECVAIICPLGKECCHGECVHEGDCCRGIGDWCGLEDVAAGWDGSPQLNCCDGLVCCENWNSQGSVCAECCNDWDCPKGGYCDEGWCKWDDTCDHDKDCPKGTCCCKDGSCSGKCCHHHHPKPKPPKPAPTPDAPVTTLPATGAGPNDERNGLLGATALGAAAALYAAKKLRETPEGSTEA